MVEAEAWIEEGRQLANDQELDQAEAALSRVAGPLDEAGRFGRSDPRVPEARAGLHMLRATMRFQRGQPPADEIAALLAATDAAAMLEPDSPAVPSFRGAALLQQVQYAFVARPRDALSLLERAASEYRRAVELDGGEPRTLCTLGRVLYYRAFQLGETRGEGALEAARRLRAGEDPTPSVDEAVRWLDRSAAGMEGDVASQVARGDLALVEARWAAGRGTDLAALLGRAERIFAALAGQHPQLVYGHDGLAQCALERAARLARQGGSPAAEARRGLESVERALERDPREPRLSILRARLEALAGDRAAARRSLDAAWALNPLVRGSWESREAEEAIR